MVQLFIDESGVHLTPDHIWTFCCLSGDEKNFSDIHKNLVSKLSKQWPTFESNSKLHFVEMLPEQKELVMCELGKLDLEFNIIYCDGGTLASFPGCSQDELKRHMIEQLILHRIKMKDNFDIVFIDKCPLSKKSIILLPKDILALLKLKENDEIDLETKGNQIELILKK